MKVIVAGSRDIIDYDLVAKAIQDSGFEITELVSGGCRGVDQLGELYSRRVLKKEPTVIVADWRNRNSPTYNAKKGYDPRAGYRRNGKMALYADALVAVWASNSPGTKNMIELMAIQGKPTFTVLL